MAVPGKRVLLAGAVALVSVLAGSGGPWPSACEPARMPVRPTAHRRCRGGWGFPRNRSCRAPLGGVLAGKRQCDTARRVRILRCRWRFRPDAPGCGRAWH